jgi:hypothetical protein
MVDHLRLEGTMEDLESTFSFLAVLADLAHLWQSFTTVERLQMIVAGLACIVAALAAACAHLWARVNVLERFARRSLKRFALAEGEIDDLGDKVDATAEYIGGLEREFNEELDEVLAAPPLIPEVPAVPDEDATVYPIGLGHIIRRHSSRPPGQPPRKCIRPPASRLERPGLRPQSVPGPFAGQKPDGSDETT